MAKWGFLAKDVLPESNAGNFFNIKLETSFGFTFSHRGQSHIKDFAESALDAIWCDHQDKPYLE